MQKLEVYDVQAWDGGSYHRHSFYLSNQEQADLYKEKHPHDYISKTALIIFDSLEEAEAHSTAKVRRAVWDKLSPLERKAIGMVEPAKVYS